MLTLLSSTLWPRHKYLLHVLIQREVKARYKQSILGYAWVILVPLLRLVVLSVVFSFFFRVDTSPIPYAVFLFSALVPWQFVSTTITASAGSIIGNANLITKIKLPRVVFPVASMGVKVIDTSFSAAILLLLLIFWAQSYSIWWLFVPVIMLVTMLLAAGISLLVAAINVYFRDVENILEVFLMIWMYLSPIIYPPEFVPEMLRPYMNLNPLFGIINAYRNTLLYGIAPAWESFIYACLLSVIIFVFGYFSFTQLAKNFADVV